MVWSVPVANARNISGNSVRLLFSEYIDQPSFERAVSIVPSFKQLPRFRWQGREVTIQFPEPFRANTTYILSVDHTLRDFHGVALKEPIMLAFSTGTQLNQGEIAGKVVDAATGNAAANVNIFAYLAPTDTTDFAKTEPDYRIQTKADGSFLLQYLPEAPFFILALTDRNRNRRLDATEKFATPPFRVLRAVTPDTTQKTTPKTTRSITTQTENKTGENAPKTDNRWVLTKQDTLSPTVRQVRSISSRRMAVQFSEEVFLQTTQTTHWALQDSVRQQSVPIRALSQSDKNRRFVSVHTDSLAAGRYRLRTSALADSSQNRLRPTWTYFSIAARADTVQTRFLGFAPVVSLKTTRNIRTVAPHVFPQLLLNQPVDDTFWTRHLSVTDTAGVAVAYRIQTEDNARFVVIPQPEWKPDQVLKIQLDGQFMRKPKPFVQFFQQLPSNERGRILGRIAQADRTTIVIELYAESGSISRSMATAPIFTTTADAKGAFAFRDLPEGSYRLRWFKDLNVNGRWDGGTIRPFLAAEPLAWRQTPIIVRPNRDTEPEALDW